MRLPEIAIKNHVFAWMLMAFLIIFGAISYTQLGVSLDPDIEFPSANIRVTYEGASVEVIEKSIIDPIEESIVSIQGLRTISSVARIGLADINIEFDLNKDIDVAVQELQSQILAANQNMPDDVDPAIISKTNPTDRPILFLGIRSGTKSRRDLMILIKEQVQDKFSSIEGVADVGVYGFVDPTIRVDLNPDLLKKYDLTPQDIVSTIREQHKEQPAGWIERNDKEESIRVFGEIVNAKELGEIVIPTRGGNANYLNLKLKDVAHIYDGLDEIRRLSRVDGQPTVAIGIRKQRGANSVAVAQDVIAKVEQIRKILPKDIVLDINFDRTIFIRESVHELLFTLVLSALLTALVCWAFLGSWSATINVILAIPTSIIGSFIVLNALDFTLNTFTLLGLSLAIGIVVDDAIIMLENIFRYLEMGKNRIEAAHLGSREITFAVIATTAAIVAIFLPVAFMDGIIGRYFFQFGVTISVAVILSTIEALTLAPMRLSRFGQLKEKKLKITEWIDQKIKILTVYYEGLLKKLMPQKTKIFALITAFFLVSLSMLYVLKVEFAPAQDEGYAFIYIRTPQGSSIDYTDEKVKTIEKLTTSEIPWITHYYVSIGGFGAGGETNAAILIVFFNERSNRPVNPETGSKYTLDDMDKQLREKINGVEGVRAFVQMTQSRSLGAKRGYPIEFTIKGGDTQELIKVGNEFIEELNKTNTVIGTNSEDVETKPEIQIIPNREKASRHGIKVSDITQAIQILYGGVTPSKYSLQGRRYDILVKLAKKDRTSLKALDELYLRNVNGELVALKDLIDKRSVQAPLTIFRENRQRGIRINANINSESSQAAALKAVESVAKKVLPSHMYFDFSGSSDTFFESFQSLLIAMILGIIISYMVLASQFNSFRDPIIILTAFPFGISGAFWALYVGGQTLNVYSMIGFLLLMGISKKNGIMLVEFANQLRDKGMERMEATITAATLRLRPILMTSFATIAAAIPPAVNFGPGAETRVPMALSIIGGVAVSTVLTLLVVPLLYERFSPEREVIDLSHLE